MAKKNPSFEKRVKLLVAIIRREDEAALIEACNECCVSLHFSGIGYGTARSNYMSYLGLDEIEKRVVYALIPNYSEPRVLRAINRKLRLYLMGNGIAFTVPLSGISNIVSNAILTTPSRDDPPAEIKFNEKERKLMHELIIAVVNQKYTDKVLDCSRAAGATGATILHTRSINNKQAEQLIGTSLKQETDTVAFLTTHEFKMQIMEAIRENAGLKTDGGAVIFSLPVDSLVGIGRLDDEDETVGSADSH
jgi:nitrogen regulatory protein PII